MNINKYTEKAREAVAAAVELAKQGNNPQLEPEHLLVALATALRGHRLGWHERGRSRLHFLLPAGLRRTRWPGA